MKCLGADEFKDTQKPSVKSGFIELDKITHGWENGDLIVIASRPVMGKTAFGISLLRNIAIKNKIPVAFFSLRMSVGQFMSRFVSTVSEIENSKIFAYKKGDTMALNETEQNKLNRAEKQIDIAPVFLDDTPYLDIEALQKKAIRLASDFQIKLIVIDCLQLMSIRGIRYDDMNEELAVIVRSLKTLAKNLNVPIIVFSYLKYDVDNSEKIDGKRPQLRDLRNDTIEQDADVICFIHRPEYYRIFSDKKGNDLHGKAEIIVAKNRNGDTGEILLKFNKECSSFDNLDE